MGSDMSWRQVTCCLRFRRRLQTRWRWWTRGWRATLIMEWKDQGGTAGGAIENSQTAGNRDATSGRQLKAPRTTPSAVTPSATATSTRGCDREGKPAARGDGADRQDQREDHEQPVRDKETEQEGGDAPGQSTANLPRPRAAKVEGWRLPGLPVHSAVCMQTTPPEIQGTAKRLYPSRAPTEASCTPAACCIARNTSPEGMPIRGPGSRVVQHGREATNLPTRWHWLEGCPCPGSGKGGRRLGAHCSSPPSFSGAFPDWGQPATRLPAFTAHLS